MRDWTVLLFAAIVSFSPVAIAQNVPNPGAPRAATPERHVAPTGKVKPPGAAVPEGDNRMDELERKADRLGRQMERSICRC
jgi:hypothetical protein